MRLSLPSPQTKFMPWHVQRKVSPRESFSFLHVVKVDICVDIIGEHALMSVKENIFMSRSTKIFFTVGTSR